MTHITNQPLSYYFYVPEIIFSIQKTQSPGLDSVVSHIQHPYQFLVDPISSALRDEKHSSNCQFRIVNLLKLAPF